MSSAKKLLTRMRQSKSGWRYDDLDALYRGFGFEVHEGSKHAMYIHPQLSQLRATVARHRSLPVGYIQHAIKLIDQLITLQEEKHNEGRR